MLAAGNQWLETIVLEFLVKFLLVFGFIGLLVGLGLMFFSARMQLLFGATNQTISLRQPTRWLEVPRDIGAAVRRHRLWFGLAFVAGGVFGLLVKPDLARLKSAFSLGDAATIAVDSMGWLLITGNAVAVVIGLLLLFAPQALDRLEAHANRWISTRQHSLPMHKTHMKLDELVMASPRAAGVIIAAGAIYIVLQSALVLLRMTAAGH